MSWQKKGAALVAAWVCLQCSRAPDSSLSLLVELDGAPLGGRVRVTSLETDWEANVALSGGSASLPAIPGGKVRLEFIDSSASVILLPSASLDLLPGKHRHHVVIWRTAHRLAPR